MANRMDKWLHHTFSSGCETGSDYDAFQREARADLRKQAKAAGYRTMAHDKDWTGGYNCWCSWPELGEALSKMRMRRCG